MIGKRRTNKIVHKPTGLSDSRSASGILINLPGESDLTRCPKCSSAKIKVAFYRPATLTEMENQTLYHVWKEEGEIKYTPIKVVTPKEKEFFDIENVSKPVYKCEKGHYINL